MSRSLGLDLQYKRHRLARRWLWRPLANRWGLSGLVRRWPAV